MAVPCPDPRRTHAKFPGGREGSAPCPARFRGSPHPLRTAQGRGVRLEPPDGLCPEKTAWRSGRRPLPPALGSRPPLRSPPGRRRRPRALTESGAGRDRWERGRRLRLDSAAASRPATSPQGRRPARGSELRGGGGGLASMARGSG